MVPIELPRSWHVACLESAQRVEPKAWKIILNEAGIADLRMHDLRRAMGSRQASTGANLSVIAVL
jgi:hypothetical protein